MKFWSLSLALQHYRALRLLLAALILLAAAIGLRLIFNRLAAPAVLATRVTQAALAPATAQATITHIQEQLRQNPDDARAYAQLGHAYLQRVREAGDAALYTRAATAFQNALDRDAQQVDALTGQGMLALAKHDFTAALDWADQARAALPLARHASEATILGIEVDALVELGRYDEAVLAAQAMMDIRPDLGSYSRVAYLNELHGDTAGALEAMQRAAHYSAPGSEPRAWTLVEVGHLYFNQGRLSEALASYQAALQEQPRYAYAQAGVARVWAAQGHVEDAITQYRAVLAQVPAAEFAVALGELYLSQGQTDAAREQFDLVQVFQALNMAAGMNVDLELALFMADHADFLDVDTARAVAQARTVYRARPTIYAADVLAWTLYQHGAIAEARRYSDEALRLHTQDALLHFHAGMIAHALGDTDRAQRHLSHALTINPDFSPLHAPTARNLLEQM